MNRIIVLLNLLLAAGCTSLPPGEPARHLSPPPPVAGAPPSPVLSPPVPEAGLPKSQKRFSAVVTEVPVRQLLFALARDAGINLDLAPGVEGKVTLNAIDQTLTQILERLARQVNLRYRFEDDLLIVEPDTPYFEHYPIAYVNIERDSVSRVGVSNRIGTGQQGTGQAGGARGGAGQNESTTSITSISKNQFWSRLVEDLRGLIADTSQGNADQANREVVIVAHPESAMLSVKATARQHREIRRYLNRLLERSRRQVLIEATVVEVVLRDEHQAGVDWAAIKRDIIEDGGQITASQDLIGANLSGPPVFTLAYAGKSVAAQIKMLTRFGTTRVISSPRLMVMNNQTALLRVVENRVYFTTTVDVNQTQGVSVTTTETIPHTVSVGFVMNVTPQIEDDDTVMLHVRPTLSRIIGFVKDPNPALAQVEVESLVPEVSVQEMESLLKLADGDIGIIGGLMQDNYDDNTEGVPGLSRIDKLGYLFSMKKKNVKKSELVVFIRPTIIRHASLDGDLKDYRNFLTSPGSGR
ncbi:MAG TPA: type II and III secretion system protein [Methylothermaceae bacterium]|nr:type II and III secretion system protein [Methylothermaceae bacterium]